MLNWKGLTASFCPELTPLVLTLNSSFLICVKSPQSIKQKAFIVLLLLIFFSFFSCTSLQACGNDLGMLRSEFICVTSYLCIASYSVPRNEARRQNMGLVLLSVYLFCLLPPGCTEDTTNAC